MDETIGVKGGHNDRRRTIIITKKNKEKLEQYEEERYIKELEKKVKKQQKISLLKTLPIAVAGKTFTVLYDTQNGKRIDKEEEGSKLRIEEYDGDFTTKPIGGFNTPDKRDELPREKRVIIDKDTGKYINAKHTFDKLCEYTFARLSSDEKVDISEETEKKAENNIREFLDKFSKSL